MSAAVADDSVSEKSSMMWRDNLSSCSSIQQHHGGAGSLAGSSAAGGGGCSLGAGTTVVGPDGKVVRVKYIHIALPRSNSVMTSENILLAKVLFFVLPDRFQFGNFSADSGVLALSPFPGGGTFSAPQKLPPFVLHRLPPGLRKNRAAGGKGQHQVSAVPRDSPP